MATANDIVAIIKRRIENYTGTNDQFDRIRRYELEELLTVINHARFEKLDLEKEIEKFLDESGAPYVWCNDEEQKDWCTLIAKHFYELGRNAK